MEILKQWGPAAAGAVLGVRVADMAGKSGVVGLVLAFGGALGGIVVARKFLNK